MIYYRVLFSITIFLMYSFFGTGQEESNSAFENEVGFRIRVASNVNWTDTRLDVIEGQRIHFKASGGISLQQGNPIAYCGPDGYNLKTVQQPISDKNIGALIGKVVQLLSIEVDEETGEEIRNEHFELFYLGSENDVMIPLSGRLFLGINEIVVGDNAGEFEVLVFFNRDLTR
ncbi:hypothetical protein ACFLRM_06750 [Acidobacteriota bacterium]